MAADKVQNAAYMAARQEWDERWGSLANQKKSWRLAFFVSCIANLGLVMGMVSIVKKSTVIPFVIAVNDMNQVVASGFATESSLPNPLVVQAKLAQYVENARSVSTDKVVTAERLQACFAATAQASPAFTYLKENWTTNSPFLLADSESVEVNVHRVLQISPKSYEVDWTETKRSAKDGGVQATEEWRAILGVTVAPAKKNDQTLVKNPLGIYVTSISWSKAV